MTTNDTPATLPVMRSAHAHVFPTLTGAQIARLAAHGHVRQISRAKCSSKPATRSCPSSS